MPRALLLSPHLDDVAFSCGGIAATLAGAGWHVVIATVFTRSVHPATGFALACQRDKHLPDETDYMAVRREEDARACAALGAEQVLLDLLEAPNRGYGSAAALFAGPRADDPVATTVAAEIARLFGTERPDLVLAPQGCGSHVDHLQLIDGLLRTLDGLPAGASLGFYRDTPYVIRDPAARPDARIEPLAGHAVTIPLAKAARARKQAAVACFGTQLGFQFGGAEAAAAAIEALMLREGEQERCGHAEQLLLSGPGLLDGFAA